MPGLNFGDLGAFDWTSLALGGAGDIMGAVSAYQQAQQQRAMYDRAKAASDARQAMMAKWTDPTYATNYINAAYQPLQGDALKQMLRMENAQNAQMGVADGAYGTSLVDQALAAQDLQRRQMAVNQYAQALQAALGAGSQDISAIQAGTAAVPNPYGTTGGTAQIMQQLMMLRALQQRNAGGGDSSGSSSGAATTSSGDASAYSPYGQVLSLRGGSFPSRLSTGVEPYAGTSYIPDTSMLYDLPEAA